MRTGLKPRFLPHLLVLLAGLSFIGCSEKQNSSSLLTLGGLTMGTTYTVKINETDPGISSEDIHAGISQILADVNQSMSTYIDDSELSIFNRAPADEWIALSPGLHGIISDAEKISTLTSGSFDITVGQLVNLWGFGPAKDKQRVPTPELLAEALANSGLRHLQLRDTPPSARKDNEKLYLDLSAIAKGYGVDQIADYLEQHGIANYLVEIGGEIRARGVNEINFAWRIGIEQPIAGKRAVQRVIKLQDTAMATSGDYRNYFEYQGKRYSHTIDPRTGSPVTHDLVSVTVLHASATWADALATGFLVMGREAAQQLAIQEGYAVLFLEKDGDEFRETWTPAFEPYLL